MYIILLTFSTKLSRLLRWWFFLRNNIKYSLLWPQKWTAFDEENICVGWQSVLYEDYLATFSLGYKMLTGLDLSGYCSLFVHCLKT